MRTTSDADAEAWVLTTDAGRALLAAVVGRSPRPGRPTWRAGGRSRRRPGRRRRSGSPTAADAGRAKFARAARMWFEPTGLEQATAEAVARHKARRFAGRTAPSSTSAAGSAATPWPSPRVGRRRWPSTPTTGWPGGPSGTPRVYEVGDRVAAVRARAESFADPGRGLGPHRPRPPRPRPRRARDLDGYQPGPATSCRRLARSAPGGAIKLGPGERLRRPLRRRPVRGRTRQPRRRVQGGDRLVRRRRRPAGAAPRDSPKARPGPTATARRRRTPRSGPSSAGSSTPTPPSSARACSTPSPRPTGCPGSRRVSIT